jgi:acyl transferase domain-containing protein/pimeloyl-ACP methyl ester carboxylesterase
MRRDLLAAALEEIRSLRAQVKALGGAREQIAVVGIGCRLPGGAHSPAAYWDILCRGEDAIVGLPGDRWARERYHDSDPSRPGRTYVDRAGFLRCPLDTFDTEFFGISPKEAASLDPQQRVLLEVAWEALEDAAIVPSSLFGSRTAVYVGISSQDYGRRTMAGAGTDRIDAYSLTGSHPSIAVGRISYVLGLRGPALAIDTACSSSLVAVHQACAALRAGACDVAIAGGVNMILSPDTTVALSKLRALSPDGHCRTFDAAANGYVRSEGCALVVLKRLTDAVASGDRIVGLIRGSALNHDGRSNGLTAPSAPAQAELIRAALADAELRPEQVGYVECHGTGTPIGDPIEVQALAEALLNGGRPAGDPLVLGAVKSNIGHLEAAAGIASLIKALLAVRAGEIPPNLHFQKPNPNIDWKLPIVVPTQMRRGWGRSGERFAGVSSFGFSGTNVHLIVGSAPEREPRLHEDAAPMLLLSARSDAALRSSAARWAERIAAAAPEELRDLTFTAATGRERFRVTAVVRGSTQTELTERLTALAAGEAAPGCHIGSRRDRPKLALLFTGQGSQYAGMGKDLYRRYRAFRQAIDDCATLFLRHRREDLRQVLFDTGAGAERINGTGWTQPCVFAIDYALAQLWRELGATPDAVLGHSIGEVVAAVIAGIMELPEAVRLVHERSQRMAELPLDGAMASLQLSEARAMGLLADEPSVSIAAINGPQKVVISGLAAAVERTIARATAEGVQVDRLVVSHAFHSSAMEPALPGFARAIAGLATAAPAIPIASNVYGTLAGNKMADPSYWVRQVRDTVRFADGMRALHELGVRAFVECGPRPTLLSLGRGAVPTAEQLWLPSLRPGRGEEEVLLDSLAALGANGWPLPATALFGASARKVSAPTYPFQRSRHWIDAERSPPAASPPLLFDTTPKGPAAPAEPHELRPLIRRLVAAALGVLPNAVDDGADLYALGMDSLLLIELAANLERTVGRRISVQELAASASTYVGGRPSLTLGALIDRINDPPSATVTAEELRAPGELVVAPDAPLESPYGGALDPEISLESGRVEIASGFEIEYLSAGRGETVLLLPLLDGTIRSYLPLLRRLSRSFRAVAINYPGWGRSTPRLEPGLDRLASIVRRVIDGLQPGAPVHLVGWSFGGFLAQQLAAEHPDRVASLTLLTTTANLSTGASVGAAKLLVEAVKEDFAAGLARIADPARRDELKGLFVTRGASHPGVFLHYAAAAEKFDARALLARIKCPTLVVSGGLDRCLPPEHAELLHRGIAGSRWIELELGGHFLPLFDAAELGELFEDCLSSQKEKNTQGGGRWKSRTYSSPAPALESAG